MIAAAMIVVSLAQCGVRFSLPHGWQSELRPNDNDAVLCTIGVKPPRWPSGSKRWGPVSEHPISVVVFAPSASYDDAVDEMGFERDENGRIGVLGFRSHFDPAEPFHAGILTGVEATPFYRGYAAPGAQLRDNESRVYSAAERYILAKTPDGRLIGIECTAGTPDDSVDCDEIISDIARTLRRTR